MTATYSHKALIDKLGYREGDTVMLFDPVDWFVDYLAEKGVVISHEHPTTWAHGFFTEKDDIANFLQFVISRDVLKGFWVCWPKKASAMETNLTEQTFRDVILPTGWVDTKVCAIDETWSGLLFKRRAH